MPQKACGRYIFHVMAYAFWHMLFFLFDSEYGKNGAFKKNEKNISVYCKLFTCITQSMMRHGPCQINDLHFVWNL